MKYFRVRIPAANVLPRSNILHMRRMYSDIHGLDLRISINIPDQSTVFPRPRGANTGNSKSTSWTTVLDWSRDFYLFLKQLTYLLTGSN